MSQGTSLTKVSPTVWKLGASGGTLGTEVDIDNQIGAIARIVKIGIYCNDVALRAIVVHYQRYDGLETSYCLGEPARKLIEINFHPTEYITCIKGWIGTVLLVRAVVSIEIETNLTTYGPYRHWSRHRLINFDSYVVGNWYEFNVPNSRIIAFHGRSMSLPTGVFVEAIGVYVKELLSYDVQQEAPTPTGTLVSPTGSVWKYGPCGGRGGTERNLDRLSDVARIVKIGIRYVGDAIIALTVYFQRLDGAESSYRYGGQMGGEVKQITFGPNEYITRVRGSIGYLKDRQTVKSIELETNRSNNGPYGQEHPEHAEFDFHARDGHIIGFHGRSGSYLDAIGVYIKISGQEQEGTSDPSVILASPDEVKKT